MSEIIANIIKFFWRLLFPEKKLSDNEPPADLPVIEPEPEKPILYVKALECIGRDLSPTQSILGCAEVVNQIHKLAFGDQIGGGASTWLLWQALEERDDFQKVEKYEVGAVIISPSGTGKYKHGHVGICGETMIISNDSDTGLVASVFNEKSWREYFENKGGFPVYFFRKK